MKFLQTVQLFIELNILSKPQQWISQNNGKISFNYNYTKDATFNLYKDLIGILFIFDRSCGRLAQYLGPQEKLLGKNGVKLDFDETP